MIEYRTGNILECEADALVNTVNCVGVMGRGIALQFKKAFPENFEAYRQACKREEVQPGRMFVFETGRLVPPRYIINFPTKRHWRGKSRIEDIEAGLDALVAVVRQRGIRSIAIPPLGSGLGGLHWPDVKRRIAEALGHLDGVEVFVYEPRGAPEAEVMARTREVPRMTPGRAALVALMHRYLGGLLDPSVTLLEIHKLMYFAQEAGEPLRLRFNKALYGPYAANLRHVLNAIEAHMTVGYADGGDRPDKEIRLVPGAYEEAARFLAPDEHRSTRARLDRVADLIEGFESPFGLELLSSAHWLLQHEAVPRERLVEAMHAWNERKRVFTPRQIGIAASRLQKQRWLSPPTAPDSQNATP
ncbi:MAG: Appr-1-p processing protein [Armatimonadetes bacterium]|nr:MAG: Appr-1-p processing protein [Armatimonadota bacterium]